MHSTPTNSINAAYTAYKRHRHNLPDTDNTDNTTTSTSTSGRVFDLQCHHIADQRDLYDTSATACMQAAGAGTA